MTTYRVYVLWSGPGGCHYIGISEDVEHRLAQHNQGESRWTRRFAGTWVLAWTSPPGALSEARRLENLLKRQKGGDGFFRLTGLPRQGSSGS